MYKTLKLNIIAALALVLLPAGAMAASFSQADSRTVSAALGYSQVLPDATLFLTLTGSNSQYRTRSIPQNAGSEVQMIPPSVALRAAMSVAPGGKALGVRLMQGQTLMYSVKIKTGHRLYRVLVDARTGQVIGQ